MDVREFSQGLARAERIDAFEAGTSIMDMTSHSHTIFLKTGPERDAMRAACQAAAQVLLMIEPEIKAGVTTGELDRICRDYILGPLGCESATIGYDALGSRPPFSGAICTSVNHVVCHGVPGEKKLKNGDILNIDVTVIKDGSRRYQSDVLRWTTECAGATAGRGDA
jgi:methionine aminopeptidase